MGRPPLRRDGKPPPRPGRPAQRQRHHVPHLRPLTLKPAVYLRTNRPGGILYTGVTANLWRRNQDYHLAVNLKSFVNQQQLMLLVHIEYFQTMQGAIAREKYLKKMSHNRKLKLITAHNPTWRDLTEEIWQEN